MEQLEKERRRKGFTMSEVLVVVVILAITLAIAVPAMIGGIRRMNLNRLDDSARSIFVAAQNSMTAMVGNGEFEHFADGVTDNEVVDLIGKEPSDFDASHGDSNDLRYLDSKNVDHEKALSELLPGGSIDKELEEHRYVVEYNCKTGAVYAVWYSDKKNFEDNSDAYTGEPREYDERLKNNPLIGYYGGSGVNYALVGQMPIPELTVTNAEELRLHIKMPAALGGTGFDPGKIGLKVSVTGKTSNVSIPIIQRDDLVLLDEDKSADLMLDTLNEKLSDETIYPYRNQPLGWKTGKAFKDWVDESDPSADKLIPGEDISVTVTTYYADTDKLYLSQSATVNCNSLFARVEKKDDPDTSGTVEQIPTAIIAYGRHLQNLDALTATGEADGQIGVGTVGGVTKGTAITAAEQTEPIDFNAVNGTIDAGAFTPGDDSDNIYYWANTYGKVDSSDGTISDLKTFDSLYNSTLTAYNGNSLPIRNLNAIENTDVYAGLFSHIAGSAGDLAKLKNITLINPAANAKNNAGALAGMVNNVKIENCQVYLEGNYNPTSTPKITMTDTDINRAGGLVGVADGNVNITDSFAAVVVEGNATCSDCDIGGLVGETSSDADLTIKKSYAACYLNGGSNGGNKAGGLVGNVDNSSSVSVSNSYADGIIINVKNGGTAAGLVTNAPSGSTLEIFNSYAAVRYSEEVAKTSSNVEIFGAAPNTSPLPGAGALSNNVYYVSQTGAKYVANSGKELNAKQLSEMPITAGGSGNFLGGDWYDKSGGTNPTYATFPYGQTDETKSLATPYPYPMLKDATGKDADGNPIPMFHYGDWLESETEEPAFESIMAYYDTVNSVTGYYAILNKEARINTLGSAGAAITDGYAVLSETELTDDNLKFTLNDDSKQYILTAGKKETIGSKEYYRHDLPKDAWTAAVNAATENAKKDQNYYQKITLNGGQVLLFNPLFACEAVNGPYTTETPSADLPLATAQAKPGLTSRTTTVDDGVVLRTPRHLANAAALSADDTSVPPTGSTANDNPNPWRIKTYHQLLDINYSIYKYVNNDLSVSFTDGTKNSTPQTPLLLGDKDGTSGKYEGEDGAYYGNTHEIRGAYIGSNDSARETNSSGGTSERYVAGLFGLVTNDSTVDGVRLVNAKVTTNKTATNTVYVGAVAGKVAGEKTLFTDCGVYVEKESDYNTYAVSSDKNKVFVGGFAGEFEGKANGCFAAVKVKATGKSSNAGGFVGTFKDATVTDCYAGGHTENGKYTSKDASVNVWVSGTTSNAGGFAGQVTDKKVLTLSGVCYTTCSVRNDETTQESDECKNTGCFVGLRPDSATSPKTEIKKATDATVYATGVAFKSNDVVDPRNEKDYLTKLIPEMDGRNYTFTTTPYDSGMTATADYPYITNLTAHYGDWPTKHNLVYYEKYNKDTGTGAVKVDGSWYGFYGKWNGTAGTQEVNSLAKDGYAVDSGYALISDQDLGDSFLWGSETYGSSNGRTMVYNTAEVGKDGCVKLEKSSGSNLPANYVYTLPFDAVSQAPLDTYYRTISINGATTVCNPHFACEALNISNGDKVEVKLDDDRSYTYRKFDMDKIQSKPGLMYGTDNEDYKNCVLIRTPQHLASAARYTRQKNNLSSRVSSRGWAYHQLLDLDYSQYTGGIYDGNSGLKKEKNNVAGKQNDYPQLAVTLGQKANSTSSDDLDKKDVTSGSYNGHGHTIANLYAGISQESYVNSDSTDDLYAGVFGWVYQSTIENIQLKNITVNVGTTSNGYDEKIKGTVLAIGGLAGRCSDSKVSGVTLGDVKINVGNDAEKAKNVGGLFGSIEGSSTNIKECGIRVSASTKYDNYGVVYDGKKTSYTGGFAGNVSDATVQNCYAAVKVTGYNCAGGFVGTFKDATVTDCYAGGHTVNGVYAPTAPNVTAKYENSSSTVGGFAGSVTNKVNFTGVNYSTCSVSCNTASAKRGRFVGNGTNTNVEKGSNAILYGLAPAFRDGSAVVPTDEKAYLTGQLAAWKSSDNADATPYDTHWGKKYPYQVAKGQKIHYGDWMDLAEPSLVYYEEYATAGITPATTHITTNNGKFYGLGGSWKHADSSADEGIASLSNNAAESINEDGYALLWPVDESYSYTGNFPETLECTIKGTKVTFKRIVGDGTGFYENAIKLKDSYYYLYLPELPTGTDLNSLFTYAGSDYYQTLTYNVTISEGGVSVSRTGDRWFNPHFALEAYNTKPTDTSKPTEKASNMLDSGTKESAVIVRTARQFSNLADYAVSGKNPSNWSYHQTMDLHFDGTPFTETPVPFLGAGGSYNGHSHRLTDLQVKVKDTTGSVGVFGQIDGATVQKVQLLNSEVDVENSGASSETNVGGLVGLVKDGAKLENNTGINVKVTAKVTGSSGNARVGGLFGQLKGESSAQVEVKNCGVYIDTALATTHTDIDGDNGAYNYYSVDAGESTISATSGNNDYTGGLAGDVNQASLEKCYAAVKVTGYKYTGGLAGQLNGCTVTDCYAGGHTVGGEYVKPTATSTPAVNVTGLSSGAQVGGFIGQTADEVEFNGVCYTTCSVFAPNITTNDTLGLFSGGESSGSTVNCATDSTLYATGKAWAKDSGASGFADATARSETEYDDNLLTERKQLLNVIVEEDNKDSKPYDSELFDNGATPVTSVPYLYKTNFDEHHGDWGLPDKTLVQSAGILYFEMDTDNKFTYQIAGVTSDGDLLSNSNADDAGFNSVTSLDTLCVDRHMDADGTIEEHDHIKTSGYVLFNGDKFRLASPTKDTAGLTGTTDSDVCNKVLEILDVTDVNQLDELEVFVTPSTEVKGNSVNKMFSRRGYHSTEKPLYYTNGFAGVSDKEYSVGNPIAIRTVRQLDNIDNATLYFKQTHDLYGKDYLNYTGATKMQGGYDGDHRYILGLNMTGEKNVGLFSTTGSADLYNIILYSPDGKANITSTNDPSTPTSESARWGAGGLVGKVDGRTTKITNCVVAGYTIDGGSMIGGLVGYAYYNVNIKDCAAVNTLSGKDNDKGNVSIGGLLGGYHSYNTSDTLEIEESYAGGKVNLVSTNKGDNIIGGIVGKDYDDANKSKNNAVKNCYTYLDVTGVSVNTTNANTIYAIGYGLSRDDSSGNAYRKDCLPTAAEGLKVETNDQGIDATNGTTLPGNTGAAAERSYVPKDQKGGDTTSDDGHSPMEKATSSAGYPYRAVVKDDKDKFVHYGYWPKNN